MRKKISSGAVPGTCNKCGHHENSTILDTVHRRCSGVHGEPPRAKRTPRATGRGEWKSA